MLAISMANWSGFLKLEDANIEFILLVISGSYFSPEMA